jgi:hypothetical protein
MPHTLRTYRALRTVRPRKLTPAGRFWAGYCIAFLLLAYIVVDLVTRAV